MASAGGLSDQIVEAPVEQEPVIADAGPSINPTLVVVGIIGALLLAATLDDDDDSSEPESTDTIESGEIIESTEGTDLR